MAKFRALILTSSLVGICGALLAAGAFWYSRPTATTTPPDASKIISQPTIVAQVATPTKPVLKVAQELPRSQDKISSTQRIIFLGDMMFDRHVAERMRLAGSFSYPFDKVCSTDNCLFRNWDVVIGNLEGPVTSKRLPPVKEIDFAFNPKILPVLKQVGLRAVSQANNHTLDQGRTGAEESRAAVSSTGIAVFGDEVKDDAVMSTTVIETSGKTFALVGFNITDNPLDEKAAQDSMVKAKASADFVIVFIHWGNEYQAKPNASQVSLAHKLVAWGAQAIIGGHPHWMQSVEVYEGIPIIYSLGNFIFDQDWSEETNYGLVAGLTIRESVDSVDLIPIKIVKSQPTVLTGQERETRLNRLAEISDKTLAEQIKEGRIKF